MANATTNQLGAAEASIRGTLPHPHSVHRGRAPHIPASDRLPGQQPPLANDDKTSLD